MEKMDLLKKTFDYIIHTIETEGVKVTQGELNEQGFTLSTPNLGTIEVEVSYYPEENPASIGSFTVKSIGEQPKELKFTDKNHFSRWLAHYDQLFAK